MELRNIYVAKYITLKNHSLSHSTINIEHQDILCLYQTLRSFGYLFSLINLVYTINTNSTIMYVSMCEHVCEDNEQYNFLLYLHRT